MFTTKTILSQMQSFISGYDFEKVVLAHNGDKGIRKFSTKNLMSIMIFTHMSAKESIRDIIDSLSSKKNLWYHLGLQSISRNNLSYALGKRPQEIFEKTFYMLLGRLQNERGLLADKRFKFKLPVRVLDSTTIGLCLSLFDWAKFRTTKGGIKLHVMLNPREQLPEFMISTVAGEHDIQAARQMPIVKNAIIVMDKGYIDFNFLQKINKNRAFFVTRTKSNTQYRIIERMEKTHKNIRADWKVKFSSYKKIEYPEYLRIVRYRDIETNRTYEFMTNNFNLSAKTIADIYKSRWDIELFFKWIKQNLKIKTFIGTSENAVKIQIWTAMIAYLLTEYIRFKSKRSFTLLKTFRILRDNILHSYDLFDLLREKALPETRKNMSTNLQMTFGF